MDAMKDAASLLCRIKTDMNPESTVGIVADGLPLGPKVLCSCGLDMGVLLTTCASLPIAGGKSDFVRALEVSALALKHRRNKESAQRIVAFVGSPVEEDEATLVKLAKKLKKNNIFVDIVAMGEIEHNEAKLQAFIVAVNKESMVTSHLVVVPPGVLPSEVLMTSPVVTGGMDNEGESGGMDGGATASAFAEYGGYNPSIDPEMALAMRESMETARAGMRHEEPEGNAAVMQTPQAAESQPNQMELEEEMDEDLRQALAMSLGQEPADESATGVDVLLPKTAGEEEDNDEARELAMALALSQMEPEPALTTSSTVKPSGETPAATGGFMDEDYVRQLTEGLDGIDVSDPSIQKIIAESAKKDEEPDNKKQKKEDKDEK